MPWIYILGGFLSQKVVSIKTFILGTLGRILQKLSWLFFWEGKRLLWFLNKWCSFLNLYWTTMWPILVDLVFCNKFLVILIALNLLFFIIMQLMIGRQPSSVIQSLSLKASTRLFLLLLLLHNEYLSFVSVFIWLQWHLLLGQISLLMTHLQEAVL